MNLYIYASFLNQRKYDSILAKIEIRITDLGLNGKIARLGATKNIREIIENETKRGATTVIVVGNDHIINEAISVLANKNIPLGIIPINEGPNNIAKNLGIAFAEKACDLLSARRIEKLDIVAINNNHFLLDAVITNNGSILEITGNYSIETSGDGKITITNMSIKKGGLFSKAQSNPQDGIFELLINTKPVRRFLSRIKNGGESIFPLKDLRLINTKSATVLIDGVKEISTPAEIKIIPSGISLIIGKSRAF